MDRQALPSLSSASIGEGAVAQDRCLIFFSNFSCFNVPGTALNHSAVMEAPGCAPPRRVNNSCFL